MDRKLIREKNDIGYISMAKISLLVMLCKLQISSVLMQNIFPRNNYEKKLQVKEKNCEFYGKKYITINKFN